MTGYSPRFLMILITLIFSISLHAQKDAIKFLGIPVDGYKSDMIQKLKAKGFNSNPNKPDVLDGEFNGTDVYLFIVTTNNKVWRIAVTDVNTISEGDIKIRFNNLLRQFQNNKNYLPTPDSTILKNIIPEDEDISYEISVKNKRYQAIFYQKTSAYDSLALEKDMLMDKKLLSESEKENLSNIIVKSFEESMKSLDRPVWFLINERNGKYDITIFYDNENNKANGQDL